MKYPEKIKAYNRQHSMDEDEMISLWRDTIKKSFSIAMASDNQGMYSMLKLLSMQFLVRTRKYSHNEAALEKFYNEYEQEVKDEK